MTSDPARSAEAASEPGGRWLERLRALLLLALVLAGAAAAFKAFRWYVFEDAYITFRYAANLADGRGFAFNPGEAVLGTSTPAWTLLLALARRLGGDIPTVAALVATLSVAASAWCGARILQRLGHPHAGVVYAAALACGVFALHPLSTMETGFYCLLLHAGALALLARRELALGACIGLACLTRYDGAVFAALALALLWFDTRRVPWRGALVAVLLLLPWLVYAQSTFGSVLPNTYHAKSGSQSSALAYLSVSVPLFLEGAYFPTLTDEPLVAVRTLFVPAALACLPLLLLARPLRAQPLRSILVLQPALLWLGYAVIGPDPRHWWHVVPAACLALLALLWGWGELLARFVPPSLARGAALLFLGAALFVVPRAVHRQGQLLRSLGEYHERALAYEELARWFRANELTDLSVLINEPGYFTWLTDCRVIDGAGLVTPGIRRSGPPEQQTSVEEIVQRFSPDVIVANKKPEGYTILQTVPRLVALRTELFRARLEALARAWLTPDAPSAPAELATPFAFDFEAGAPSGFWGAPRFVAAVPGAHGLALTTDPAVTGFADGSLSSPSFRLDFDELRFACGAEGEPAKLEAQLVIDGAVVLAQSCAPTPENGGVLRWPVGAWRGRVARLRLDDRDPAGFLWLDELRSVQHAHVESFDDFEGEGWSARWTTTFAPAPLPWRTLAERLGLRFVLGRASAASLGRAGACELVSAPFVLTHDALSALVLDCGGPKTRVELHVDGQVVRSFAGARSLRWQPLRWDLTPWRGREAVLEVVDGDMGAERGLGLDAITLFDAVRE